MIDKLRFSFAMLLCSALVLGTGCASGTEYELSPSEETPGAAGQIAVDEDDNDNLELDVEINHVPPPDRLSGELTTYVAWLQPTGSNRVINLGALKIDDDRRANLRTTTPHESFIFFVTAETSGRVAEPSDYRVLTRQIDVD